MIKSLVGLEARISEVITQYYQKDTKVHGLYVYVDTII